MFKNNYHIAILILVISLFLVNFTRSKVVILKFTKEKIDLTNISEIKSNILLNKNFYKNFETYKFLQDSLNNEFKNTKILSFPELMSRKEVFYHFNSYKDDDNSISDYNEYKTQTIPIINNVVNDIVLDQMLVKIEIGTPIAGTSKQVFKVVLDTGSNVLWVAGNNCLSCSSNMKKLLTSSSSTYQLYDMEINLKYGTGYSYGYKSSDMVGFSGGQQINFDFSTAYSVKFKDSDGILGISYNNPYSIGFSFIDQLKKKGVIEKIIISQKFNTNLEGEIIIGDYPDIISNKIKSAGNSDFLGSCPLIRKYKFPDGSSIDNPYWSCHLHGVFSGFDEKKLKPLDEIVIFDTGSNYTYVSKTFWNAFLSIFSDLINSKKCRVYSNLTQALLNCDKTKELYDLQAVNLVFGYWSFYIKIHELFDENGDNTLVSNFMIFGTNTSEFILGEKFLKLFISITNKDNNKFELYGNNMFRLDKDYRPPSEESEYYDGNETLIIILCVFGVILIIILVFLITKCIKYYQKNRQQHNNNAYNRFENNPVSINPGSNAISQNSDL